MNPCSSEDREIIKMKLIGAAKHLRKEPTTSSKLADRAKKTPIEAGIMSGKVSSTKPAIEPESEAVGASSGASKSIYEAYFRKSPMLEMSYKLVYEPCNVTFTSKPKSEAESQEYGGFEFAINNIRVKFRVAKSTPTKVGQFVTLWKRMDKGPIMPYDKIDPFDVYVVCVKEGRNVGQFVFPKQVLVARGILSKTGKGGKRAIRVYSPWVKTESLQASNTKKWQTQFFINFSDSKIIDLLTARKLYGFSS